MSEVPKQQQSELPSGYTGAELLPQHPTIGADVLPWLTEPTSLNISRCTVEDGSSFLVASVIDTHHRLVDAANAMTAGQSQNTNNMFYSRIVPFVKNNYSPTVDTMEKHITPFSIRVMRNKGGQRVYFGIAPIEIVADEPPQPVVLRLAVCDKNKQTEVMKVLAGTKPSEQRAKKR